MIRPADGITLSPARATTAEVAPPGGAAALLGQLGTDHPALAALPAQERPLAAA